MRDAGARITATAGGRTIYLFGLPEFKRSDAVGFPIVALILGIFYFIILLPMKRRQKKVAILVSKEPHCLETLLDDFRAMNREYLTGADQVMSLAAAGRKDEATALLLGPVEEMGAKVSKISGEWIAPVSQ